MTNSLLEFQNFEQALDSPENIQATAFEDRNDSLNLNNISVIEN